MSDWWAPVDNYCERTDPSFWAEPANALTNAAFLIAAVAAWACWRRSPERSREVLALVVMVGIVGVGSFLFHTLATRGAKLLDVIPIALFIYGYLFMALRRLIGLGAAAALGILVAFAAGSYGLEKALPVGFLNGSAGYIPALVAMLAVGGPLRQTTAGRYILAAAGVFAVSLGLRSVDNDLCAALPLGTHFLWHTLNGLVLFLLLRAAMDRPRARSATV